MILKNYVFEKFFCLAFSLKSIFQIENTEHHAIWSYYSKIHLIVLSKLLAHSRWREKVSNIRIYVPLNQLPVSWYSLYYMGNRTCDEVLTDIARNGYLLISPDKEYILR